jgi:mono/diheme cytochrome c family protein
MKAARMLKKAAACLVAIGSIAAIAAGVFVYSGTYDVSATEQHTVPVYWLVEATMRRSVHARSASIPVPPLDDKARLQRGLRLYDAQCARCHGAPGVAPEAFALGLTPTPANLTDTAKRWNAADIYWVVKHGIKATGMPGWKYRLSEQDLWDVTAFVHRELRSLSPVDYRVRVARAAAPDAPAATEREKPSAVDPTEGKRAIEQYACATCHFIPGITGATKGVGPTLRGIANRAFIAGVLRNTPENMVTWLKSPPRVDPLTAMPDLGVNERDARNIAAYLATLDR